MQHTKSSESTEEKLEWDISHENEQTQIKSSNRHSVPFLTLIII